MKAERIKQGLLAALGMVMVYIWWGNLEMFTDQAASYSPEDQVSSTKIADSDVSASWEYKPPKVNPFKRFGADNSQATQKRPQTPKPQQRSEPPISNQFTVTGILLESDRPQAVLKDRTGQTVVVSVGDSLGLWEVMTIGKQFLVCKAQTQSDTLWHGTLKLQP